jgi:hypothetical protein
MVLCCNLTLFKSRLIHQVTKTLYIRLISAPTEVALLLVRLPASPHNFSYHIFFYTTHLLYRFIPIYRAGGADNVVVIWKSTGQGLLKYTHTAQIQRIKYNPNAMQLVSCSDVSHSLILRFSRSHFRVCLIDHIYT